MTITPVASKHLESISAEPNADAPSGFDILLAGASAPRPTASSPDAEAASQTVDTAPHTASDGKTPIAGRDTARDGATPAPTDKDTAPASDDNIAGLLAVLAALGWTAPVPAAAPANVEPATGEPSADTPAPDAATAAATAPTVAALIELALAADANATGPSPAPTPATTQAAPPATAPVDPAVATALEGSMAGAIEAAAAAAGAPAPTSPARPAADASQTAVSIAGAPPQPEPTGPPAAPPSTTTASSPSGTTAEPPAIAVNAASTPAPVTASADPAAANDAAGSAPPIAGTVDHARPAAAAAHPDSTATTSTLAGNGPAPSQAPTEASAVEPVTATPAAPPPPPAEQLVHVLTPMRSGANGTYTLHIELKPAELGRVEMRVEMKDGVMHASIHSDHEGSAQLLRDALGDLRDRLEAANVHTGELTVTDGGVGARDQDGTNAQPQSDLGAPADSASGSLPNTTAALAGLTTLDPDTTSLLDVRV